MESYTKPAVALPDGPAFEENDVPVIVAALGWVLVVFGSAWAFCLAVCGWGNIAKCEAKWLEVVATCRS